MTVTLWVLLAALAHAAWNAMLKAKREGAQHPLAGATGLCLVWALVGFPLLFVVPLPAVDAWPSLIASVVIHLVYLALLVAAYRRGDLSSVYAIARGTPPLLVALAAWGIVGERLSPLACIGVLAIVGGVLAIGLGSMRRAALGLALGTALCIAAYTFVDGIGARRSGSALGYLVWLMTLQGGLFAGGALVMHKAPLANEVRTRWRGSVIAGVLSAGGYGVALWAMTQAPLGLVAALRETSIVFAALFGVVVLGERFTLLRFVSAIVVALGVVAIRLGG